jgi:hypothetical protein
MRRAIVVILGAQSALGTLARPVPAWAGPVVYVDDDAPPGGDGTSWSGAVRFLRDALDLASQRGSIEVRVAQGLYRPDRSEAAPEGTGDRSETFALVVGCAVRGGFAGPSEPDPDARDVLGYPTILCGDLLGNDGPEPASRADNSFHVVTNAAPLAVVLEGVTVTGGNAGPPLEPGDQRGGGLTNTGAVDVVDCTFSGNTALVGAAVLNRGTITLEGCLLTGKVAGAGAAMFSEGGTVAASACHFHFNSSAGHGGAFLSTMGAQVAFTDCTFLSNCTGVSAYGGAVAAFGGALEVTGCQFEGNEASMGGAVYITNGALTMVGCALMHNGASGPGGAVASEGGTASLASSTFVENASIGSGGAVASFGSFSTLSATGCTFAGNSAQAPPSGTAHGGAIIGADTLSRCTFWANGALVGGAAYGGTTVEGCSFFGNHAAQGGAAYIPLAGLPFGAAVTVATCLFSGNTADEDGGAMVLAGSSAPKPRVAGCTFSGNAAGGSGGGVHKAGNTPVRILNGILWGNQDGTGTGVQAQISGPFQAGFSCIQGVMEPAACGNIGTDPLLADADGPDDVAGTPDDDLHLLPGSPCIDAGNADLGHLGDGADIDGEARVQQCLLDSGADESPFFAQDCNGNGSGDACDPDCDGDGIPDACDTPGSDCNRNGVPDACDTDCNRNGEPDECEIVAGLAQDCNGNGVPDECDILPFYSVESGRLSPIGLDSSQFYTLAAPPLAADGPVSFTFTTVSGVGDPFQGIVLWINGQIAANLFFAGGSDCPPDPDVEVFTMSAIAFNLQVTFLGPDMILEMEAPGVDAEACHPCGGSYVSVAVEYTTLAAPSFDRNGNGVPDECECPTDVNRDGAIDVLDLVAVLLAWGTGDAAADINQDGTVDVLDLVAVLTTWGTCP